MKSTDTFMLLSELQLRPDEHSLKRRKLRAHPVCCGCAILAECGRGRGDRVISSTEILRELNGESSQFWLDVEQQRSAWEWTGRSCSCGANERFMIDRSAIHPFHALLRAIDLLNVSEVWSRRRSEAAVGAGDVCDGTTRDRQ